MNKYYALLVVGGISFGTASIFIKFSDMSPSALAFFRFFISGLILSAFSSFDPKKVIKYSPFGLLLALHMLTFIISVYTTTIIDATVLVSTSPFFVILLSRFTSFKNTKKEIVASIIGFIGVILVNFPLTLGYLFGNVIAIISAVLIAIYTTFLSRVNENSLSLTSSIYLSSSIFTFPLIFIQGLGKIDLTSILSLLGLIFLRFSDHGTSSYFSIFSIPWSGLALGVVSLASTTPHGARSSPTPWGSHLSLYTLILCLLLLLSLYLVHSQQFLG